MVRWCKPCLVALMALVFIVGTVAAGDFGLRYSVPGFDGAFRGGIGTGLVAVVKANASLSKYELELDRRGTTALLQTVANNLTSPLNQVLGHVAASFGANGTDSLRALAEGLEKLAEPTAAALETALAEVRLLEGKIRPNLAESLVSNVTTIATEVATLVRNWSPFEEALQEASASDSGYTAGNVSTLVTTELVQSVTSPVRLINAALRDISEAVLAVGKERSAAIAHEVASNSSLRNARLDLDNQLAIANRSLTDTARQMEQQVNGTLRQIRDGFNGLLARLTNESDVELVRGYLLQTEAQAAAHNERVGELWRTLASNYSQTVKSSADAIAARLSFAAENLTDSASLSESVHTERCLQRFVGELRQGPFALTRLSSCYQADGRTPNYFASAGTGFLDQLRFGANYAGTQAPSVCAQASRNCTLVHLESLDGLGRQNQARLDAFGAFLAQEMGALSERHDICARAIVADIEGLIAANDQKFTGCLVNGR